MSQVLHNIVSNPYDSRLCKIRLTAGRIPVTVVTAPNVGTADGTRMTVPYIQFVQSTVDSHTSNRGRGLNYVNRAYSCQYAHDANFFPRVSAHWSTASVPNRVILKLTSYWRRANRLRLTKWTRPWSRPGSLPSIWGATMAVNSKCPSSPPVPPTKQCHVTCGKVICSGRRLKKLK
jgi:hypothetical protein